MTIARSSVLCGVRSAIPLFVLACCAMGADEPKDALPVLFTGRLMGYFRVPDQQTSGNFECRDGLYANSPQVDGLERRFQHLAGGKPRLLVGLGDNFSPDLLSRFIYQNGKAEPKDTLLVDADNVGCFLRLAGYDAVVPGKHDFAFGPERLREYARYLAQGPAHTRMLGANLAIVTTSVISTKKAQSPKNQCKLDLPDAIFPWMQNFTVQGAYEFQKDVTVNPAGGPKHGLSDFSPQAAIKEVDRDKHQLKILDNRAYSTIEVKWTLEAPCVVAAAGATPADCGAGGARALAMTEEGLRDRHPDGSAIASHPRQPGLRPVMLPPAKYCFLATAANGKVTPCREFIVQWPFFEAFEPDTSKWAEPYVFKNVGGETAAIFGVVDGGLKEHVGLLNYSWSNTNPDLDTQLLVADPVAGLDQALQYCYAQPECRDARKILLAQMPHEQAQLLAGTFRLARTSPNTRSPVFELVLAQTDDLHGAVAQTSSQDAVAPYVLSPGQIFEDTDGSVLHVRTYRAELSHHFDAGRPKLDLTLTSDQEVVSPGGKYKIHNGTMELPDAISHKQLQTAALEAMRERRNTDIALVQRRDLFELPDSVAKQRALSLQEQMDTVFWKGDFVVHIDVTGAQLKSVMDQSHQFDQMDASALDSGLERGRGLLSLGIWQDDDKNWIANGATLDPNRLYSVAATDYLAFGDTGYTGLRPARLPRIGTFELVPLSSLVCHRIGPTDPSCRAVVLPAGNYFDQTDAKLLDPKPPAGAIDDLEKWIHITAAKKPPADEDGAQNHTVWSATLEKADIGYSFYHHDPASQVQLKSEFAGVPQTQVVTANSIAISNDYRLRIVRSGRRWDRYLLAEESYEHDVKQASDDTRIDSQASNMMGFESGLNYRITPDGRRLPAVKLLASMRVETNPGRPLTSFSLKPGGTLVRPIDRQTRFPAKIGTRIENKVSWLEFGYQISRNLNSPLGYEFVDPNTQAVLAICGATSARQKSALATCISNASDPTKTATPITTASDVLALTQNRWQHGMFLNFKLQVPLIKKDPYSVQYVMENTGNLYFHYFNQTDYSLDTHWLNTWTHTVTVKLSGNISLAPKVQYLFYENMVDHLHMHSIATSVGLQYNFAWHSGMSWKDTLTYADPTLKTAK